MNEMAASGNQPAKGVGKSQSVQGWQSALALIGFMLVAIAQVSNMILARGLAGSVPPFSLAFFRWTTIAAGLAPFALAEIRDETPTVAERRLGDPGRGFPRHVPLRRPGLCGWRHDHGDQHRPDHGAVAGGG